MQLTAGLGIFRFLRFAAIAIVEVYNITLLFHSTLSLQYSSRHSLPQTNTIHSGGISTFHTIFRIWPYFSVHHCPLPHEYLMLSEKLFQYLASVFDPSALK